MESNNSDKLKVSLMRGDKTIFRAYENCSNENKQCMNELDQVNEELEINCKAELKKIMGKVENNPKTELIKIIGKSENININKNSNRDIDELKQINTRPETNPKTELIKIMDNVEKRDIVERHA